MFYSLLKIPAKIALKIYCKKLQVNHKAIAATKGPLLLAGNHPNSFLDAILLCTIFDRPVYSLARGDAFKKPLAAKILKALYILPVYREREGTEHLQKNYDTFNACINIFKQDGIVLIFSEALCVNEWHLRPLKKGTARLAAAAWQQNIPLQILPIGINYSSFTAFGKHIIVNTGSILTKENFSDSINTDGKLLNDVTNSIEQQLKQLVFEIDKDDTAKQKQIFDLKQSSFLKALLFIPAVVGWMLHLPFYFPLQKFVHAKALHTGHYDSIILGSCFLGYPFYLLLLTIITYFIVGGWWSLLVPMVMPVLAWCWVRWKG